jgi:hypothetical protein
MFQNRRMIYGYARVSTEAQDLTSQLVQLKGAGCEKVFREKITGTTADRPQRHISVARDHSTQPDYHVEKDGTAFGVWVGSNPALDSGKLSTSTSRKPFATSKLGLQGRSTVYENPDFAIACTCAHRSGVVLLGHRYQ